jgi:hypothetical protein
MAVNKPIGDNARKGAVRKRTQGKGALMGKTLGQSAARRADASWT